MKPLLLMCCAAVVGSSIAAAQRALPPSQLELRGNVPLAFWRSDAAPSRWTSFPLVPFLTWQRVAPGVDVAELQITGSREAWRTRVVLARLDPGQVRLSLDTAVTGRGTPSWQLSHAPTDAVFAVNAGQFRRILPWGQVVLNGHQWLAPERGPLAATFVIDSAGTVAWQFDGDAPVDHVAWAFQSYPVVLRNHEIPAALRAADRGIDVGHRDARLAIGRFEDGTLVVVITRFDALGKALGAVPFGLTIPEMAAIMGAVGAVDAMLLDGGISAQMFAGRGEGRVALTAWRSVPLGLIARPRTGAPPR